MRLIPAIDVLDGQVVRLHQGDYADSVIYANSPLQQLVVYQDAGAKLVHIVDLDAAKSGEFVNRDVFHELIIKSKVALQVAGGVRAASDIEERLELGIQRVVVGSKVVTATQDFCDWIMRFGPDKIVAAIDVKKISDEFVPQVHGWTESSDTNLFELLDVLVSAGLKHLLCTDIAKDGMLSGPNYELYTELLRRYPNLIVQASGGVSATTDLEELERRHIPEAISGKALLDGRIDLNEAVARFSS